MWINNTFCYGNNVSVLLVMQKGNFLHTNKFKCRNMAYVTKMYCSSVVFITEVKKAFYVYYYTISKMYIKNISRATTDIQSSQVHYSSYMR